MNIDEEHKDQSMQCQTFDPFHTSQKHRRPLLIVNFQRNRHSHEHLHQPCDILTNSELENSLTFGFSKAPKLTFQLQATHGHIYEINLNFLSSGCGIVLA